MPITAASPSRSSRIPAIFLSSSTRSFGHLTAARAPSARHASHAAIAAANVRQGSFSGGSGERTTADRYSPVPAGDSHLRCILPRPAV